MLDDYKLENTNHIILSILVTYLTAYILTKKKINKVIVILVAVLISKISVGDWDVGLWKWTIVDICYWITLLTFAFLGTLKLF